MLGWLFIGLVVLAILFVQLRNDPALLASLTGEEMLPFTIAGSIVLLLAMVVVARARGRTGGTVRSLAAWTLLAVGAVAGYAYRDELTTVVYRVAGELLPPGQLQQVDSGPGQEKAVRIRRRADGHFIARTDINGSPASMLVDTGASSVVLRPADAERVGLDLKRLNYSVAVQTANGTTYAAPVRLKSVAVGPIRMRDVEALVAQPGTLKESLLGMTFLKRLRSYEFSGDFLTLRS